MIDFTIIGAGIQGMLLAIEIKERFPEQEVVIFEQEPYCGDHTSGRNSGVLHSGIYYETNSKKHQFCILGNQLWNQLASKLGIEINRCGKFIFANPGQEEQLEQLIKKAEQNKVSYRAANDQEIIRLKSYVDAENAIYIPSTGILDVSSVIKSLEYLCKKLDIHILKKHKVTKLRHRNETFTFIAGKESVDSKYLFNCAGLWAIEIREQLGLKDLKNLFVRGTYFKTHQKYFTDALLYPLPEPKLKGLGVHTTFDETTLRFGPDTEEIGHVDYHLNPSNLEKMKSEIAKTFKNIELSKITPDYCGIRPKILQNGILHSDFWIQNDHETKIPGYFELCGIESPGLTAAPAISKYLADHI